MYVYIYPYLNTSTERRRTTAALYNLFVLNTTAAEVPHAALSHTAPMRRTTTPARPPPHYQPPHYHLTPHDTIAALPPPHYRRTTLPPRQIVPHTTAAVPPQWNTAALPPHYRRIHYRRTCNIRTTKHRTATAAHVYIIDI